MSACIDEATSGRIAVDAGARKVLVCRSGLLPYSETFIKEQLFAYSRWSPVLVGTHRVPHGLSVEGLDIRLMYGEHSGIAGRVFKRVLRELSIAPPSVTRRLRAEAAALIHIHFGTDAVAYWPAIKSLDLPVLVTLHGFDINIHKEHWQRARALEARRYPDKLLAISRLPGVHFIAVSDAVRERAIAYGIAAERISVRYIGIDRSRFAFLGLPVWARKRRILYVGRMVEKKGGEFLIRAFAAVREVVKNAELVMVGDGPLSEQLKALARRLQVPVQFPGSLSSAAVKLHIDAARVFCLPSVTAANGDAEGLPISILEAQSCGVPVVTSARGGATEGIVHGITGLAFAEADTPRLTSHLIRLLQDDTLAASMSDAGPRFIAAKFDIKKCTASLEDLYEAQLVEYRGRRQH